MNLRAAEKAAALQAVEFLSDQRNGSVPMLANASDTIFAGNSIVPKALSLPNMPALPMPGLNDRMNPGPPGQISATNEFLGEALPLPPVMPMELAGLNPKMALNVALGKISKRVLLKDDQSYETQQVAGGFQ